jgi:hypothetical protein
MTMLTGKGILKVLPVLALLAGLSACGRERRTENWTQYLPTLIRELEDPDYTTRRKAARALGRMGPLALCAVPALDCAREDENCTVREEAQIALSCITRSCP